MGLVKDKPQDLPSGNDLDNLPDDLLEIPPAYLSFGSSPAALPEPPELGDTKTYIVRAILGCWESGKQPPNTDEEQPGLFDEAGNAVDFGDEDGEGQDDGDGLGEFDPEFSHNGNG